MADIVKTIQLKVEGLESLNAAVDELKKVSGATKEVEKAAPKAKSGIMDMAAGFGAAMLTIGMAKKAFKAFTDALGETKAGKEAMDSMKKSFTMIMDAIVTGLMPVIQDLAKMFAWAAPYIGAAVQAMAQVVSTTFFAIKTAITFVITSILSYWEILLNTLAKGASLIPGIGDKMASGLKTAADAVGKSAESMAVQTADSFGKMITSATTWGGEQEKVMSDAEAKRIENQKKAHDKEVEEAKKAAKERLDAEEKARQEALAAEEKALQASLDATRRYHDELKAEAETANSDRLSLYDELSSRSVGIIEDEFEKARAAESVWYENKKMDLEQAALFNKESASTLAADLEAIELSHREAMANIDVEDKEAQAERDAETAEKAAEEKEKALKEEQRKREENLSTMVNVAQQFQDIISGITQVQLAGIDEWADKQKEKARSTIKNQEQLQKELEKIDKEKVKKEKEAREKEKAMAIVMAIINTAVAITKALDTNPFMPMGPIMAGLAAATGAVQIALIASQSFAKGGIVEGTSTSGDNTLVRANAGELILNKAQQDVVADRLSSNSPQVQVGGDTIIINGNADATTVEAIRQTRTEQLQEMREMLLDLQYRGQMVV